MTSNMQEYGTAPGVRGAAQDRTSKGEVYLSVDPAIGTIVKVHPVLEHMLGFAAGELDGKPLAFLSRDNSANLGEELATFVSQAAHDIVGPVNQTAALAGLLVKRYESKLDADAAEILGFIRDGADRMKALAESIKSYVHLVSLETTLGLTDSGAACRAAVSALSSPISESGAVITQDTLPEVKGDAKTLVVLFRVLIENAIKFGQPGVRPEVHVSVHPCGSEWVFSVRDNGIGIEPQFHESIFNPFRKLHGAEYPGFGLGLSIARRIVGAHQGRIWVASEPDQGSDFQFTLQRVQD